MKYCSGLFLLALYCAGTDALNASSDFTGWGRVCGGRLRDGDVAKHELAPWEQELVTDYSDGVSSLGRIVFATSTTSSKARAHFILGLKALTNFMYDFSAYEFGKAAEADPRFGMAYWGLAMSRFQAIWNNENVSYSRSQLTVSLQFRHAMTSMERTHLSAALALHAMDEKGSCDDACGLGKGITSTDFSSRACKFCRYKSFDADLHAAAAAPRATDDLLLQSYLILSGLALGSQPDACSGKTYRDCPPLVTARKIADKSFGICPYFAATLHYGLHAHDFPDYEIYTSGIHFASDYPKRINASVHSLHMPSHLWDRAGNFSAGAHSNLVSLNAAKNFAAIGATSAMGARRWEYNAGNIYHSLEYEQYELLMRCDLPLAARLAARMDFVRQQSIISGHWWTHPSSKARSIDVVAKSAAYAEWSYRMVARQLIWTWSFAALGALNTSSPSAPRELFTLITPLPLPWTGGKVSSNAMYAPQSEAAVLGALAFTRLFDFLFSSEQAKDPSKDTYSVSMQARDIDPKNLMCGFDLDGDGCVFAFAEEAKLRIAQATSAYASLDAEYEAYGMKIIYEQVETMSAYAHGNLTRALAHARRARDLQLESNDSLRPTSTSVLFLPGDAFFGVFAMFASGANISAEILRECVTAFDTCLSPQGRPNHTVCLLGMLKALRALGEDGKAEKILRRLSASWDVQSASFVCQEP